MANKRKFVKDVDKIVSICNELFVDIRFDSNDIVIKEFENGMVSSIFHILFKNTLHEQITKSNQTKVNQRDRDLFQSGSVVIKFFPKPENVPFDILSSEVVSMISGIAYQQNIGPQVLLVKKDVLVISFIEGRLATPEDDSDEHFFQMLATKLAQFHSMKVPIPKNNSNQKIVAVCDYWIAEKELNEIYKSGKTRDILVKKNCSKLLREGNYGNEIQFVKNATLACNYPVVFIHGDLNYSNIILVEKSNNNCGNANDIRLVDFDFSAYQHRGIDLAKHFADLAEAEDIPILEDERMLRFIGYYIDENCRIYGDSFREERENSPEQLLKETKLFTLYIYIIHINFSLWYSGIDQDKAEDFVTQADKQFGHYLTIKQQLQAEKCLPDGFN